MLIPDVSIRDSVAASLAQAPIIGVVRTGSREEALRQALLFRDGGIELIEITFTVPDATGVVSELVRELKSDVPGAGPPWLGMGTVTTAQRAKAALAVGARFLVTPNVSAEVAAIARESETYLVMGAMTVSEIVAAHGLGAQIVKVYPLAPIGGPAYLATVRQPLADIPMLAAGGFGVDDIPAYRSAGASAFGIGAPLVGANRAESLERIARALSLARSGR